MQSLRTYLVTGSAGFIGSHVTTRLLEAGHRVIGIDDFNPYYDVKLKRDRNERLAKNSRYLCLEFDIADKARLISELKDKDISAVIHLAAQAGVRHSLGHPDVYTHSNIDGTLSVLELARVLKAKPHLLLASSSSVYGASQTFPLHEEMAADRPSSLYGATKRANEMMGHAYSHLFGIRVTMLRFFTVYGPWGRPDMALFKFTDHVLRGEPIELYNSGDMVRDFTYVDDIVEGTLALEAARSRLESGASNFEIFNIGCAHPRTLSEFVTAIEAATGKKAIRTPAPFQPGDVYKTYADVSKLKAACGYEPKVSIEEGIVQFVRWFREYYGR